MARPAPAIPRAASILNLLAAHPGERFTLSEILRALPMNRASLHATLASLVDVGFLYRANDKSYALGPGLIRIARVARDDATPLSVAKLEMRAIADEADAVCSAVFRERDEAVVRERAVSASHIAWAGANLSRFPLVPPMGLIFFVWTSAASQTQWLDRIGPLSSAERDQQMRAIVFARENGYMCGVRKHMPERAYDIESPNTRLMDTEFAIDELSLQKTYAMTFIAAPVFDENAKFSFALVLAGFGFKTGRSVMELGKALRTRCDRITTVTGGVIPEIEDAYPSLPLPRQARLARPDKKSNV